MLREYDAGATTADVCRRHGVSEQSFYRWKTKYGGMGASDATKLKSLEDENRRLKKLLVDAMLDVVALKDVSGELRRPAERRSGTRPARLRLQRCTTRMTALQKVVMGNGSAID